MHKLSRILPSKLNFFHKLRILDYLILAIIILAGIILFRFINPEEKWITATISTTNIPLFQANALHVGDIEKDPNGKKIAEILDIQIFDATTPNSASSNKDVFVDVLLLARISPRSKEFQYKNKAIKIGTPIDLLFTSGFLSGKIADLEGDSQQKQLKIKIVTLQMYDQWPWLGEAIKIGEGTVEKNGEKISEIIEKVVRPAEVTTTTAEGQTLLQIDPRKVDIAIRMRVKVLEINDELIFRKDKAITIGETMSFDAGNTKIENAFIEKIE